MEDEDYNENKLQNHATTEEDEANEEEGRKAAFYFVSCIRASESLAHLMLFFRKLKRGLIVWHSRCYLISIKILKHSTDDSNCPCYNTTETMLQRAKHHFYSAAIENV